MCHFLSFGTDNREGEHYGKLYFGLDLNSHEGIGKENGLKPGEYCEAEWIDDSRDSLVVRSEGKTDLKTVILVKYPSRVDLLKAIPALCKGRGYRYRNGLIWKLEKMHENGQLNYRDNWKDGERHGTREGWHENGNLWYRDNWKNGEEHGVCEVWYENGNLCYRENWKDGEEHGVCEKWYENGQLSYRNNWKNGEKHGIRECWRENGNLWYRDNWKDGKLHGVCEKWNESGKLCYRYNWKNGKKVD